MSNATQFFIIVVVIMTSLRVSDAAYNAREAHRHAHEIACAVGAADLCKFHEETDK